MDYCNYEEDELYRLTTTSATEEARQELLNTAYKLHDIFDEAETELKKRLGI